jgi:predicted small lipoprotein YifL
VRTCEAAVALCLALLAGCERQLPLALPPEAPAQVFEVGGSHYTLDPSSDGYRALARWISNNRSGWSWFHYYTTPPSRGFIVRCGSLELRFFDTTVLDRTPQGDYLKTVQPAEYAFLRRNAHGT